VARIFLLPTLNFLNHFYRGADGEGEWRRQNRPWNNPDSISFLYLLGVLGGEEGFSDRRIHERMDFRIFIHLPPYPMEARLPHFAKPGTLSACTGNHLEGKGLLKK